MPADSVSDALLTRLQRLEDIEAIRQLKARYLHACDRKDVATLRDCFAAGAVSIDYGAIGCFQDRESFVQIFEAMACHSHIIDIHHGHNGQIHWHSSAQASATFDLYFCQINQQTSVMTQLGGYYNDEFRKIDGDWKLVSTQFVVTSTIVNQVEDGRLLPLIMGIAPPPIAAS